MNQEFIYSTNDYFYTLYKCNQKLVKLCGADAIRNMIESKKIILEIIDDIPKIFPVSSDIKNNILVISSKNGLMRMENQVSYLRTDFEQLLSKHYTLIDNIKKIRNNYEHEMHNIKLVGASSGNNTSFTIELNNIKDNKDNIIRISTNQLIDIFKELNTIYSKLVQDIETETYKKKDLICPFNEKIERFDFKDFNIIYDSDICKVVGKLQYEF